MVEEAGLGLIHRSTLDLTIWTGYAAPATKSKPPSLASQLGLGQFSLPLVQPALKES